jgi:hypothetical protein
METPQHMVLAQDQEEWEIRNVEGEVVAWLPEVTCMRYAEPSLHLLASESDMNDRSEDVPD